MKIAYVCSSYHWKSYSVVRTLLEALQKRVEVVRCENASNVPDDADQVWIASSVLPIERTGKFTVVIGFSDPTMFRLERLKAADLYITQNKEIASTHSDTHYMPMFADKGYFVPMNVEKEWDCVFTGVGRHPKVKTRIQIVDTLRSKGLRVRVYGTEWPQHEDNQPFVSGRELIEVFNKAHLALDLTRNDVAMGSRIFQAAMCGVPTLTCEREDLAELFAPEREIFFYKNAADCVNRACLLLANKGALEEAVRAAYSRAVRCHDVTHRVDALLDVVRDRMARVAAE